MLLFLGTWKPPRRRRHALLALFPRSILASDLGIRDRMSAHSHATISAWNRDETGAYAARAQRLEPPREMEARVG